MLILGSLRLDLSWVNLPDSLDTLGSLAGQLQTMITAALTHPFWAFGLLIVSIGLLQLIADLVKRIIKSGLAFVLRLPLNASQWLWKRATAAAPTSQKDQVSQLIEQLETLRVQQDQVVAELKSLVLSSTAIKTERTDTLPEAVTPQLADSQNAAALELPQTGVES